MANRADHRARTEVRIRNGVVRSVPQYDPRGGKIKARLALEINRTIDARQLTQAATAGLLGVSQPKVSALANYKLEGFSVERLMHFLLALGRDVEIRVGPRRAAR